MIRNTSNIVRMLCQKIIIIKKARRRIQRAAVSFSSIPRKRPEQVPRETFADTGKWLTEPTMPLRRLHALKQPILVGSVEEQAVAQFIYLDFGKAFNTLQHRRHCIFPCGQNEEIPTGWVSPIQFSPTRWVKNWWGLQAQMVVVNEGIHIRADSCLIFPPVA